MSTKIKELNEFYANVLHDVGIVDADGEGMLSHYHEGKPKPVTISKKRLCLPLMSVLKAAEWDVRIPFHPFSEQLNQGPSPVLNAFKGYVHQRLKNTIYTIAIALMDLAIEPKRHKSVGAKASKFMLELVGADQKTADTLRKVLDNAMSSNAPDKRLLGLTLKNGGTDGALRTCHVSFPVMDDAGTEDQTVFAGVKMPRKTKDKAHLVALLNYVLGDDEARAAYTSGSSDGEAPYFHAILQSFLKIAQHLNHLIKLHGTGCPELVGFEFQLDWAETMDEFGKFAASHGPAVPMLPGNRGVDSDEIAKQERANVYESSAEDVGLVEEQPARADDRDEREPMSRRAAERDREREYERSERRDNDGVVHRKLADVLGRRSRDDDDRGRDRDRADRGGRSWRRHDNDRDDRGRGRGGRW